MTNFGNQNASHYISGFQWWSMVEWWILNACYCTQASGVLNISSTVMRCSSIGEDGVSRVPGIVSNMCRHHEYLYGLGGFS